MSEKRDRLPMFPFVASNALDEDLSRDLTLQLCEVSLPTSVPPAPAFQGLHPPPRGCPMKGPLSRTVGSVNKSLEAQLQQHLPLENQAPRAPPGESSILPSSQVSSLGVGEGKFC